MTCWRIIEEVGLASDVHAQPMLYVSERTARIVDVTRSALVLGSRQRVGSVDAGALDALNAELVVRRSGGGAVFLYPGGQMWADLALPKSDPLFDDDIRKSALTVGEVFLRLFSSLGCEELEMHTGGLTGGDVGQTICFGGLGPGELTLEGAKVVGISQRRTAQGVVFQCTVYIRYPLEETHLLMSGAGINLPEPGYALGIAQISDEFGAMTEAEARTRLKDSFIDALNALC